MTTNKALIDELRADLERLYPGPGGKAERDAALKAAKSFLAGRWTVAQMGEHLTAARAAERASWAAARVVALLAIDAGAAELATARDLGVDRQAVREWRGKRRRHAAQ